MPQARTDSETAGKAQALREAADLGCTGAHRHPDGTWMACSTMEEYERLTASRKEKSGLDLIEETQRIRSQKGNKRKRRNKRQWDKLRERGVAGIDTLSGGGLVSGAHGKGLTFRPVDGDEDVFDNINDARRRARRIGCIGVSRRTSRSGRRVWVPCTNMTDYARATGSTALGRRYQDRMARQRVRRIVQEELARAHRDSRRRRKKRLFEELYDVKALGRSISRIGRSVTVFDPDAWDGDHDGIVQEGTPWERPAIPGINTNLPGTRGTRRKPKDFPPDTQRPEWADEDAWAAPANRERWPHSRAGDAMVTRLESETDDMQSRGGLRSIRPSEAVNAPLDKFEEEARRGMRSATSMDELEKVAVEAWEGGPKLFHGSGATFDEFDADRMNMNFGFPQLGIYTAGIDMAKGYVPREEGGFVHNVRFRPDRAPRIVDLRGPIPDDLRTALRAEIEELRKIFPEAESLTNQHSISALLAKLEDPDSTLAGVMWGADVVGIPGTGITYTFGEAGHDGERAAMETVLERLHNVIREADIDVLHEVSPWGQGPNALPIDIFINPEDVEIVATGSKVRSSGMRSSTAVADPDFPHPALTQVSHAEYTEMVPIEFFDEMPGNIQGQMDRDDRLVAAPAGVFRDFEKDAPIILQMTDDLTEDIRSNGIKNALMVNYNPQTGDVNLEEGNHRLIAARRLGMTHVPVRMNRTTVEREGIRGPRKQIGGMRKNERYEHLDLGGEYLGSAFRPSQVGVPRRPKKGGGTRGMRSERTRVDEPRPSPFDDEVARLDQAAATMRAAAGRGPLPPRITQADKQRMAELDPKQNLRDLDATIDEYVAFLEEHHRHDFGGNADAISAIDDAHPGLVNRHDRHKDRLNEIASFFEEERASLEEARFEQGAVQDELNSLTRRFDRANAGNSQRRRMSEAMSQGRQPDEFLAAEVGDLAVNRDALDPTGPAATWRAVEEERKEILELERKLKELQRKTEAHPNGTESVLKQFRERVQAKLSKHQRPDKVLEIGKGNEALNPGQGMRSRRDALSDHNKEWLKTVLTNPGYWDEAPAAVRNVVSDQVRQEAMSLRGTGIHRASGMRSGGRKVGEQIIGKVKPEHRNKPEGGRTLFFVGGTTGSGKSTMVRGKKIDLPDDTEAAHIDPDHIKAGLDGWDPQRAGDFHHESRRVTDRIMNDAMNAGMDMVVQGTGKRDEHLTEARRRGYKTAGHFVYVDPGEAERRIAQRKAEGGPNIPNHFGRQIAGELQGHIPQQITDGLYDDFFLWDSSGPTPRLIAYRTEGGHFAIHGREEFNAFFGHGAKRVEQYWQKNR